MMRYKIKTVTIQCNGFGLILPGIIIEARRMQARTDTHTKKKQIKNQNLSLVKLKIEKFLCDSSSLSTNGICICNVLVSVNCDPRQTQINAL